MCCFRQVVLLSLCLLAGLAEAGTRLLEDLAGRQVTVPAQVERIVLGEGRFLTPLAIVQGEALLQPLVGLLGDFEQLDPSGYQQVLARFPALERVPRVGRLGEQSFSVEQVIALRPQVVLLGLHGHGPGVHSGEVLQQLEQAGIAVLFIDFSQQPLRNTPRSLRLLGELLGREPQAQAFIDYYQAELDKVQQLVAEQSRRPRVFLENRVGLLDSCCQTIAHGLFAELISAAGGDNLASKVLPDAVGVLSLEYLLQVQPEVYLGTAIGHAGDTQQGRVRLGAGVSRAMARDSLRQALLRPGFSALQAVRTGRAHALWHHFYNSPLNVAAVQVLAGWLYPPLQAELDARATLQQLHARFLPWPLDGEYWVTADAR